MSTRPHWLVLGAGAIGGLWALRLAAAGHPVTLLGRQAAPTRRLLLEDGAHPLTHDFPCHRRDDGPLPAADRLLVTTKAGATARALAPWLATLPAALPVVLLQNGMGQETALLSDRPELVLLPAITTAGVFCRDADTRVLAGAGQTRIGAREAAQQPLADTIAREWQAAGLATSAVTDITTQRWQKLAVNCAINPLTVRFRCRNGALLDTPEALALMQAVCAEVAAVMQAEGLAAAGDTLFATAQAVAAATAANTSSMLADVQAGRATEIAFLNGHVLACAARHGIPCPVNAALVSEIAALAP